MGGVPGLMLRIVGNSRVWVLRVRIGDKRHSLGLGSFPAVTLAQARDRARDKRQQIDSGESVVASKYEARKLTLVAQASAILFKDAAKAMISAHTIENKAEAAYRRGDMLERRRACMQQWADYVMPLPTLS